MSSSPSKAEKHVSDLNLSHNKSSRKKKTLILQVGLGL